MEGVDDLELDGERDGLLDFDEDTEAEGVGEGEPDTEAEGECEGDAEGLLDGETTPPGTIEATFPLHIPEGIVVRLIASKAHLSVDCNHRQHHTARTRG